MTELPPIKKLSAREQLSVKRDFPALVPELEGYRLSHEEAVAIAFNAALLYHALEGGFAPPSPGDVLDMWSLEEIAELCGLVNALQAGDYEYGVSGSGSAKAEEDEKHKY